MSKYSSDALNAHLNRASALYPPRTFDEATATVDELVTSHLKLVVKIAAQYAHDPSTLEDYVGVGNIALISAARSFDASKGAFVTWASYYIAGVIRNHRCDGLGRRRGRRDGGDLPIVEVFDGDTDARPASACDGYARRRLAELGAAVGELAPSRRRFVRGVLNGCAPGELAERYGVSAQYVRAETARAALALAGVMA